MSSPKYIPMDLAFEHYAHVKQDLNSFEYAKICAEMSNPRYSTVTEAEGLDLYMKGELLVPDKVRVVWMHDVERPNDNLLARRMAEMEHSFGFRSSFNIRVICAIDEEWRQDLLKIAELGDHDIEYQHEDLVITQGDQKAGLESFRKNIAYLRTFFPKSASHSGTASISQASIQQPFSAPMANTTSTFWMNADCPNTASSTSS